MACNPPYKRGVTGQWDKCRFPGVLRQDCYDYINFDYDCSSGPRVYNCIKVNWAKQAPSGGSCSSPVLGGTVKVTVPVSIPSGGLKVSLSDAGFDDKGSVNGQPSIGGCIENKPPASITITNKTITFKVYDTVGGFVGMQACICLCGYYGEPFEPILFGGGSTNGPAGSITINGWIIEYPEFERAGPWSNAVQFCGDKTTDPCSTPPPDDGGGGGSSSDEKSGLSMFQSFGLDDYFPNFTPQSEPEPVFSTQATAGCNITAQLKTTGCCLEVEESTGRIYAVGSGTVSARIISGFCSSCSDFSVYINERKNSAVVQDGSTIIVSGRSTKCRCNRKTPWIIPGGFRPGPCYNASSYRMLKNIETGVYQIELNLNTNSSQNDCGCG
jgi:hypothetical protein